MTTPPSLSGSFGGISLEFNDPDVACGAGFALSDPAPISVDIRCPEGDQVTIRKASRSAVVSLNVALIDPEAILGRAHEAMQRALDVIGASKIHFLSTPNSEYDHLIWWKNGGTVTARWCDVSRLNVRSEVSWERRSQTGAVLSRSSDLPLPDWHEAMRYWRYSQITDDLYASYRDAFLAMEAVLSKVAPKREKERERAWHSRACRTLARDGLEFAPFVNQQSADLVDKFVEEQYAARRCALFHAKAGETHYLPAGLLDRVVVSKALGFLQTFLSALFRIVLGSNSGVGILTFDGMRLHAEALASDLRLAVSDDEQQPKSSDTAVNPSGGSVTSLSTKYLGVADGVGFDFGFLGDIAVDQMASTTINSSASRAGDVLITRGNVNTLVVEGAQIFEYYMTLAFGSQAGLKRSFTI